MYSRECGFPMLCEQGLGSPLSCTAGTLLSSVLLSRASGSPQYFTAKNFAPRCPVQQWIRLPAALCMCNNDFGSPLSCTSRTLAPHGHVQLGLWRSMHCPVQQGLSSPLSCTYSKDFSSPLSEIVCSIHSLIIWIWDQRNHRGIRRPNVLESEKKADTVPLLYARWYN